MTDRTQSDAQCSWNENTFDTLHDNVEDDDDQNVSLVKSPNLLELEDDLSPPPAKRHRRDTGSNSFCGDDDQNTTLSASPATQTLQQLSQQQENANLVMYEMSQMEFDAANVLATAAQQIQETERWSRTTTTNQKITARKQEDQNHKDTTASTTVSCPSSIFEPAINVVPGPIQKAPNQKESRQERDLASKAPKSVLPQGIGPVHEPNPNDVLCQKGKIKYSGNLQASA